MVTKEKGEMYIGGTGAVDGAVGLNDLAGLGGELTENLVNVGAMSGAVATVLAEAVEDLRGDGPLLPFSHLRFLLSHLTSPSSCFPRVSLPLSLSL